MLIVIHTMLLYSQLINSISEVTCFVLAYGYFMYPHFIVECNETFIEKKKQKKLELKSM